MISTDNNSSLSSDYTHIHLLLSSLHFQGPEMTPSLYKRNEGAHRSVVIRLDQESAPILEDWMWSHGKMIVRGPKLQLSRGITSWQHSVVYFKITSEEDF